MALFRFPAAPAFDIARPEDILLPPRAWFVAFTLGFAFILNLMPLTGLWLALRPDFFAIVLLYWCIHQPRWIGVGVAWLCGLLTDVAEANLFGQHALAYTLLGFSAEYFHRRVLRFPLWQQALHVLAILLATQLVVLVLRLMSGASLPSLIFLLSSVSSALIWPVASMLLQWPQRVRSLID